MSGILNNKTRVLDTIVTLEGRELLARNGSLPATYYSFTDSSAFYEPDIVSGSTDATTRVYIEAFSSPYDQITPISDDMGAIKTFASAVGTISPGNTAVFYSTSSIAFNQSEQSSYLLSTASIMSLAYQQLIGTYDDLFDKSNVFGINYNNYEFGMSNGYPFDISQRSIDINGTPSLFNDPHLSHLKNLMYLPPIVRQGKSSVTGSLGDYKNLSSFSGSISADQVLIDSIGRNTLDIASACSNTIKLIFDPTSQDNNIFCQMFEVSGSNALKLFIIDAGQQTYSTNPASHIFYVGKLLLDDKDTQTFARLFTLIFE